MNYSKHTIMVLNNSAILRQSAKNTFTKFKNMNKCLNNLDINMLLNMF